MALFNAYPPSVLHPSTSKPLSISSAHTILTTFLHLADLDPAYRPDSTLSERGPESNSSTGNPNLTLHHLNRIKLGLEGTNLSAKDLDAGLVGGDRKPLGSQDRVEGRKRKWQDRDGLDMQPVKAGIPNVVSTAEEDVDVVLATQDTSVRPATDGEGWQDRTDFELAQDDEVAGSNYAQQDPTAEGMEEEFTNWEDGPMIDMSEELAEQDNVTEGTGQGGVAGAQQADDERNEAVLGGKRALTQEDKIERRKLKKLRSKEAKISSTPSKLASSHRKKKRKKEVEVEALP